MQELADFIGRKLFDILAPYRHIVIRQVVRPDEILVCDDGAVSFESFEIGTMNHEGLDLQMLADYACDRFEAAVEGRLFNNTPVLVFGLPAEPSVAPDELVKQLMIEDDDSYEPEGLYRHWDSTKLFDANDLPFRISTGTTNEGINPPQDRNIITINLIFGVKKKIIKRSDGG